MESETLVEDVLGVDVLPGVLLGSVAVSVLRISPSGETTDFSHDSSLNASFVLAPDGTDTTSMTYDSRGNLLTATAPSSLGSVTKTLTYNSRNDVTSVTEARSRVTSYGYDGIGD